MSAEYHISVCAWIWLSKEDYEVIFITEMLVCFAAMTFSEGYEEVQEVT